jgi:predicted signal transduction protein with EAL and GGDEF domain
LINDIAHRHGKRAGAVALLAGRGQVRTALDAPYNIENHIYSSTCSIGITLFPKHAEGVEDLLREADTAMYRAKDLGRNRIRFYEAAMQADVQERLALEQDLKKASAEASWLRSCSRRWMPRTAPWWAASC